MGVRQRCKHCADHNISSWWEHSDRSLWQRWNGLGTAEYSIESMLVWGLGQGLSCMFVPDCEDMLGGGRDALCGVNFAFLRIHFHLSLCLGGFHRITADFSLLPTTWASACQTGSPDCYFFHKLPFFLVHL